MTKNDQKKIMCFVCAMESLDVDSWKNHIINSHQKNEEYLLCPSCDIPCRDLISHWKVHHRNDEMPNFGVIRVNKIYDWNYKYQKEQRKKRKWKEGLFDSIKMGKKIHYRSSWERDVMICLEKCVDVLEYYGDDHLCIPYYIHSKQHRYWPDFTVRLRDNKTYILEIKPIDQAEWEINQAKWEYAVKYCNTRQWKFQVWTQKHIIKIKTRASRHDVLLEEHIIPLDEETIKEIQIK